MTKKQKLKEKLDKKMNCLLKKDKEENYIYLDKVTVILSDGKRRFMERILETTKYLARNKQVIYDVSFFQPYRYDGKIPEGCFAVDNWICKINRWSHISHPKNFLKILDSTIPPSKGTCIYLDNNLYMENIPYKQIDKIRNQLLDQRRYGILWFHCLIVIDPAGNKTFFYPSKHLLKKHNIIEKEKITKSKK